MAAVSHYPQRQVATFDPANSSITSSEGNVSVTRKAALLPYYDSTTPAAAVAAAGAPHQQIAPNPTPVTVVAAPPYVSQSASRSRSRSAEGSAPRKRVTFSLSPSQDRDSAFLTASSHSPSQSVGSVTYIPVKETRVRRAGSPNVDPPYSSAPAFNARQQQQQQPIYYAPAPQPQPVVIPPYLPYLVAAPLPQQQQPLQEQSSHPSFYLATPSPSLPREGSPAAVFYPDPATAGGVRDESYYSSAPSEPRAGFPARQHRYRLYGCSPSAGIHEDSPSHSPDPRRPSQSISQRSVSSGGVLRSNEFLNYKGNQVAVMNRWYAEHEKPMFAFHSWMHDRYAPQQSGVKPVYFPIVSSHRNTPQASPSLRGPPGAGAVPARSASPTSVSPPPQRIAVIPTY